MTVAEQQLSSALNSFQEIQDSWECIKEWEAKNFRKGRAGQGVCFSVTEEAMKVVSHQAAV